MKNIMAWINLQLFGGEGAGGSAGAGDSSGDGASTGVVADDPGRQRLLELGVPESKLRKKAYSNVIDKPQAAAETVKAMGNAHSNEQTATAEDPQASAEEQATKRMTWDEIMADPEYNKAMQEIVQNRVKKSKAAEDAMNKMAPALELLAKKAGLDPENMDYEALANAITDDASYYEEKALELGVSLETAKELDKKERESRQNTKDLEQLKFENHIRSLEQQGEALKKVFPSFDLRTELQNPAFARMTAPNVGLPVEDAYYAVHRKEIQAVAAQVTAQKTAEKISNAIQSGMNRPVEQGTSTQAPSVTTFNYRTASKEQREAFKRDLRYRMARGEKVYPGGK